MFVLSFPLADINECKENANDLCGNGKCINSPGSFKCHCQKGFRMNGDGKCVGEFVDESESSDRFAFQFQLIRP